MDRRRVTMWAIFAVSTVFSIYSLWPASTTTAPAAAPAAATTPAATEVVASATLAQPAPPLAAADLAGWRSRLEANRRDPFFTEAEIAAMTRQPTAPAAVEVPVLPPLLPAYTLKLVMSTGSGARALIGNQVVKVGDMLGDERVVEILPNAVVLERRGVRRQVQRATSSRPALDGIHVERVR